MSALMNCLYILMLLPAGFSAAGYYLESPMFYLFAIACILALSTLICRRQENLCVFLMGLITLPWMLFDISCWLCVYLLPAPWGLCPELHVVVRLAVIMAALTSVGQIILGLLARLLFVQNPIELIDWEEDPDESSSYFH